MKEYTFICNAQLTSICEADEDTKFLDKEKIRDNIKKIIMDTGVFDDVVISNVQMFELDKDD